MSLFGNIIFAFLPIIQSARDIVNKRCEVNSTNSLARFVGYPKGASNDSFAINPNFWFNGVDFSCVSPWNNASGRLRAGTLISKRHIIFAAHYPLSAGTRIVFVDNAGNVCPCRLEKTCLVDRTDIMVGLLDSEVTPDIHPAKILPHDYETYIGNGEGLPVVTFNQHEQLLLNELNPIMTNCYAYHTTNARTPSLGRWRAFQSELIGGDSGNPAFIIIDDKPVLAYCLAGGGNGAGPSIHQYRREIQQAMDDLCSGYKLELFDFKSLNPSSGAGSHPNGR